MVFIVTFSTKQPGIKFYCLTALGYWYYMI